MKLERLLLVTGCGRSGTKYTANILRKSGLDIAHEQMRRQGTVSAPFVCYDSRRGEQIQFGTYQPYSHVAGECPAGFRFDNVWHQTRDPLKSIASVRDVLSLKVKRWARRALGQSLGTMKKGDLVWAAHHWLITNQLAERIATWQYRIEDIDEVYPEMLKELKLKDQSLPNTSRTMGRSYRTIKVFRPAKEIYDEITYLEWKDLEEAVPDIVEEIQEMAEEYGYEY